MKSLLFAVVGLSLVLGFTGCAVEPEQYLIGKWAADSSAAGRAIKAAKLKQDNPGVSGKDALDAARAMSAVGVQFRKDKTCEAVIGGNTFHGTWTFDKAETLALIEFTSVDLAPQNQVPNPEPFRPQSYFSELDVKEGKLTFCPGDRATHQLLKELRKSQPLPGLIVLTKK